MMVDECVYNKMAEALERAHRALNFASGHVAHDGKPENSYTLDFSKELAFIDVEGGESRAEGAGTAYLSSFWWAKSRWLMLQNAIP
jgi:hypothetical protein